MRGVIGSPISLLRTQKKEGGSRTKTRSKTQERRTGQSKYTSRHRSRALPLVQHGGGMKRVEYSDITPQQIPSDSLLRQHGPFLKNLWTLSKKRSSQKELYECIRKAKTGDINAVAECAENLLRGVYPKINKRYVSRMRRFRNVLRFLTKRGVPIADKRRRLVQQKGRGFFIPFLAPVVSGLLSSLLSTAIAGK